MYELQVYRADTLPLHIYYQAESFVRLVFIDNEDFDMELDRDSDSVYVVIAKGKLLISFVEVITTTLELAGQTYKCYGLSGVMTFPGFRKRGLGGQVVEAAGNVICEDPQADVALLWTAHHNVPFYEAHGWEVMPHLITTKGHPLQPEVYMDEVRMMLFLSDKGKQARSTFENGRVYVGQDTW